MKVTERGMMEACPLILMQPGAPMSPQQTSRRPGRVLFGADSTGGGGGGGLQSVLMRPVPQLSVKTCGGGGAAGGGGDWQLGRGGGLRATHQYHMHTSRGCVCLGAWGYRGMYAIIAISRLCQEESLQGLKDQRHSTPFN